MTEFIVGFTVVLILFLALINRQRHNEFRDAVARLGTLCHAFTYDRQVLLSDNIDNAERAMQILRKAQERKPDAVLYDEAQLMYKLGFEYKPELPVGANITVLSAVIRALKG